MDDENDIARDEFISELYSEFARDVLAGQDDLYGQIVDQFTTERLQAYYIDHPDIVEPGLSALDEARVLLQGHPSAALVFAVAATEVGLKSSLLKPILHGLVHQEALGPLIAELIPEQRNDKFRSVLFGILNEFAGVDLRSYKRAGHAQTLWEEIGSVQDLRNGVVHRGDHGTVADAEQAVGIAAFVLNELFPAVIDKVGLHTHGRLQVCAIRHA
jgi:hypothetical protein